MSRTDRDHPEVTDWGEWHHRDCGCCEGMSYYFHCPHMPAYWAWWRYPEPSWHNKGIREYTRSQARRDLQRLKVYRTTNEWDDGWECEGEVRPKVGDIDYW